MIHEGLKSSRGIGQPKRHDHKFKMAFMCSKSCLMDVTRKHPDLMITGPKIQLRKNCSPS
ncbi:hypothetical protein HanIR_Chr06g0298561 [Helianthus annuus]|nr:hypothetical protein HanIR_Chr06g0298561 [Helianthus annuus]